MYSTPAFRQASISAGRIGREALLMSVSSRQNFWKPPPVPEIPTVGVRPLGLALPYSSATASAIGNTVLEPSTVMSSTEASPPPSDAGWLLPPPPHATAMAAKAATPT